MIAYGVCLRDQLMVSIGIWTVAIMLWLIVVFLWLGTYLI